jgi:hypothetical protein
MANLKIGFYDNELGIRGTTLAMFNYAKYNEEVLGNTSYIFASPGRDMTTRYRFEEQFPGRVHVPHFYDIDNMGLDFLHIQKFGTNEGLILGKTPCLIQAVFCVNEPHGYRYTYISDWLAGHMGYSPREAYAVPYIVDPLPTVDTDLRSELGIPSDATVFGCYAGTTEFNVSFVRHAINSTVMLNEKIYFILMNIHQSWNGNGLLDHPQIKLLPGNPDFIYKARLINSCNAMIHAREGGETFGLAVAEFSTKNKPVLTYGRSGEACHLEILGERALIYNTYEEVFHMFNNLSEYIKYDDYNCYRWFSPQNVMDRFQQVYLS